MIFLIQRIHQMHFNQMNNFRNLIHLFNKILSTLNNCLLKNLRRQKFILKNRKIPIYMIFLQHIKKHNKWPLHFMNLINFMVKELKIILLRIHYNLNPLLQNLILKFKKIISINFNPNS